MSFDTLAPHYRWIERIFAGGRMQRCRIAFLHAIPAPQNVLLLGEGHGQFLVACRKQFPSAHITCVDGSEKMLDQSRHALRRSGAPVGGITFIQADILAWSPPAACYDLIVTNFFLDCFREDQLRNLIPRIASFAAPDASWLIADFRIPAAGLSRLCGRAIVSGLYAFFRLVTRISATRLVPPDALLMQAGFTLLRRQTFERGLLGSDWWRRI